MTMKKNRLKQEAIDSLAMANEQSHGIHPIKTVEEITVGCQSQIWITTSHICIAIPAGRTTEIWDISTTIFTTTT
jgi:hypothetical protein